MKSPIKWYGGKHYLAEWIIELMPSHKIYAEAFGGGASVLCAKQPAKVEAYNDVNHDLVQFFHALRDHRQQFIDYVGLLPYSQAEFEASLGALNAEGYSTTDCAIKRAGMNFLRWRQSFAAQGKSWAYSTTRSRGGIADCVNAWRSAVDGLYEVSERLLNVQMHCESAFDFIPRFDWTGAVIYCDPPYVGDTRAAKKVYHHEMTEGEHIALCELLNKTNLATVMLSGYDNELYNLQLSENRGWRKHIKEIANHSAGGSAKRRMLECLWIKFGNGVIGAI